MIKKTITYTDYDGHERTEDFYFNLSKAELMEMELSVTGGFTQMIDRIIKAEDVPAIASVFKELLLKSYGQKSNDGKRFIKTKELAEEFSQTEAYSELYMELATNTEAATAFINGLAPAEVVAKAKEQGSVVPLNK